MVDKKAMGKKSRAQGKAFELRVRKDLEGIGFIVDRWTNNIKDGVCVAAKAKWAGPGRPMMMGAGFPDFIAYGNGKILFVECKMGKYLDREEKAKAQWYLDHNYCTKFLVAFKTKEKNRVRVNYQEIVHKKV